jgi:hypothetical protein
MPIGKQPVAVDDPARVKSKRKTPNTALHDFLAGFPKRKQMVMFVHEKASGASFWIYSVDHIERVFNLTVADFVNMDDEDLVQILFRPRPADTDDALWAQYVSLREEHRTLGDYWAGQRKGEVLVALRHSVDFVDAHVVEDDDLVYLKEKEETPMNFSTTEDF